jgi:hypothetical protein
VIKFDEAVDNPALVFTGWRGIPQAKLVNAAGQEQLRRAVVLVVVHPFNRPTRQQIPPEALDIFRQMKAVEQRDCSCEPRDRSRLSRALHRGQGKITIPVLAFRAGSDFAGATAS